MSAKELEKGRIEYNHKPLKRTHRSIHAFVTIIFDPCFVVNGLKLIQAKTGLLDVMPTEKTKRGEYCEIAFPDLLPENWTILKVSPPAVYGAKGGQDEREAVQ